MMNLDRHDQQQPWYFAAGFILSIGMHVVLLAQLSQMHVADAEIPHQLRLVEVELLHTKAKKVLQEIKAEPQAPEHDAKKEPPIAPEKPEPVKKERPKAEKVKKPVRKLLKQKTAPKIQPHTVQKVSHAPILKKSTIDTKTTAKTAPPPHNQVPLKQIKQDYLSRILSMIQSHKHYPYSARRRHLEGDIHVSFLVDQHGHISDLHMTGGSSVLRSSTRLAIEDALPFPVPSRLLSQPMHSQFIMQYRLK